jgi:hypothetical protein
MYILEAPMEVITLEARPKQTDLIEWHAGPAGTEGEHPGDYILRKMDGSLIKHFVVAKNRRGNWAITTTTPTELEGVSTLNLQRVRKALEMVTKYWPAKQADVRKVERELQFRLDLLLRATPVVTKEAEVPA